MRWLSDNQAAVHAVNKRSCRDPDMMCLIRCLFFYEACWCFELVATHLPGRENTLEDHLSHNRLSDFLSKAQSPDPAPAAMSPAMSAAGTTHGVEGLDISTLDEALLHYCNQGLADSTRRLLSQFESVLIVLLCSWGTGPVPSF